MTLLLGVVRQLKKKELKLLDIFATRQTRYALRLQSPILHKQKQFERSGIKGPKQDMGPRDKKPANYL